MATIQVRVKPNARTTRLSREEDFWVAQLKSPPVDGKANKELVALVAEFFGRPKSAVSIRHGTGGRMKLVAIDGLSGAEVEAAGNRA